MSKFVEPKDFVGSRLTRKGNVTDGPERSKFTEFQYNYGGEDKPSFGNFKVQFPKLLTYGIEEKVDDKGKRQTQCLVKLNPNIPEHAQTIDFLKRFHERLLEIIVEAAAEFGIKATKQLSIRQQAEMQFPINKLLYIPEERVEPDILATLSEEKKYPSMWLNIFNIKKMVGTTEKLYQSNFFGLDRKPIEMPKIMGQKMDFFPLGEYSRLTKTATGFSCKIMIMSVVVVKFYDKGFENPQKDLLDKYISSVGYEEVDDFSKRAEDIRKGSPPKSQLPDLGTNQVTADFLANLPQGSEVQT